MATLGGFGAGKEKLDCGRRKRGLIGGVGSSAFLFRPFFEHLFEFFGSVHSLLDKETVHSVNSRLEAFFT